MLHKTTLLLSVLLSLCGFVSHAMACQPVTKGLVTLSLEDLMQVEVATVSKKLEDLYAAPGVATVISREEIQRFGANSLFEVLDRVASIHMLGNILSPQNSTSIRGDMFNGLDRHVLLLFNGRPFRDAVNGGISFPIYTAFPLAAIARLEIVRGPGSVLYGTGAYSGVINIITRDRPETGCHSGELTVGGGSFDSRSVEGHGSFSHNDLHLAIGVKYFDEAGWIFRARDVNGVLGSLDMTEENKGLSITSTYRNAHFNLAWLESEQAHIGANILWRSAMSALTYTRLLADVGYTWQLGNQHRLETNLTYNLTTMFEEGNSIALSVDNQDEHLLFELAHYWRNDRVSWLLGGSVEHARDKKMNGRNALGERVRPISPFNETAYTLYTQLSYQVTPRTQLIVGGQGVKNPEQDWQFIPRLGLIQQFNAHFGAKLLYSEAYRAATKLERDIQLPVVKGNPALIPETVNTFDAQLFYRQDTRQVSLTYFHSQQQDLIVRRPVLGQFAQEHFNEGKLTSQGVELEGKLIAEQHWYITGSLTYQQNEHDTEGEDYTLASHWLLKAGVSYQFASGLTLGLFNTYVSQPPDVSLRNPNRQLFNPVPDAYNLMTFNLNWPLGKRFGLQGKRFGLPGNERLQLNVYLYNLLDEAIYAPEINTNQVNSVPVKAGRSGYVRLQYRF